MEKFNTSMFKCGLSSLNFDSPHFTWTNGFVWQHLDRALVNEKWMVAYSILRVSHLARGCLDHAPLVIKCASAIMVHPIFVSSMFGSGILNF